MLNRRPVFPHVIEMNVQAGHVLGCNVYLVYDRNEWILIDIGYSDAVDEIVEMIRDMDFPLSHCKLIIATHADVDHIQGLAKIKQLIRAPVAAHPRAIGPLESGDRIHTFAEIPAQNIRLEMPPVKVDQPLNDGDRIRVGDLELDVWLTPGHTDSQLSFRLGDLLFSGDNIYRDGGVGVIDAHHGSNIPDFLQSLRRIRECDAIWLLPSHGPIFRKDNQLLDSTIARLEKYLHMPDFGTCAVDWPLMDEWERELQEGWQAR
jgi:glyoxylase-like metal-dependent hydrolase (beta-lactamase superfamily II)